MYRKLIERVFTPDGPEKPGVLKFQFKKFNSIRFKVMTKEEKLLAIEFIKDCEKNLEECRQEISDSIQNETSVNPNE